LSRQHVLSFPKTLMSRILVPRGGTAAYENYVAIHSPSVVPAPPPSAWKQKTLGHGLSFKKWIWDNGIKSVATQVAQGFDPRTAEGAVGLLSFAAGGGDAAVIEEGWTTETAFPALSESYATKKLEETSMTIHPHADLIRSVAGKNDLPVSTAAVRSARDIRERTMGGGQPGTMVYVNNPRTPAKRRSRTTVRRNLASHVNRRGI
jgi:hypothetical protein